MDMHIIRHHAGDTPPTSVSALPMPALDPVEAARIDAWWRAANYLSVGQLYLRANPLLREPLTMDHIKPLIVGHWGTTPGQSFIYAHLNRVIAARDLSMIYIAGPGHGGPALVGATYLEGSYSEIYPEVSQDEPAMSPPPPPARSTKAASWAIRSPTLSARCWIIQS